MDEPRIWRSSRPQAALVEGRRDWFRIENKAEGPVDVYIYDEIGYFGVTAADFVRALATVKSDVINLHLNTPGGDVFDGIAIHNAIKAHPATVNVRIDALAASIGSVIALAGDTITIVDNARVMIHEAFALAIGNAADMTKMAARLNETSDVIAGMYAARSGTDQAVWRQKMVDETWYTGQQAVDAGLADAVCAPDGTMKTPKAEFDLSIFRNAFASEEEEIEPENHAPDPEIEPIEPEIAPELSALPDVAAHEAKLRDLEAALGYRPLIAGKA
jgi:ATP-dependent protease ClpP protease subunit